MPHHEGGRLHVRGDWLRSNPVAGLKQPPTIGLDDFVVQASRLPANKQAGRLHHNRKRRRYG